MWSNNDSLKSKYHLHLEQNIKFFQSENRQSHKMKILIMK